MTFRNAVHHMSNISTLWMCLTALNETIIDDPSALNLNQVKKLL